MINKAQLEMLAEIFADTERTDKITLRIDHIGCNITVEYEDLDHEWFLELVAAGDCKTTPPT